MAPVKLKKPAKRPGPAPVVELTEKFIYECGAIQMTQAEIGRLFGVTQQSVSERLQRDPILKNAWEMGKEAGRMSLRRQQFKNAVEHNSTVMQIWLGKQYLDQRDSVHEIKTETNVKVEYIATWGGGELPPPEDEDNLIEGEVEDE